MLDGILQAKAKLDLDLANDASLIVIDDAIFANSPRRSIGQQLKRPICGRAKVKMSSCRSIKRLPARSDIYSCP